MQYINDEKEMIGETKKILYSGTKIKQFLARIRQVNINKKLGVTIKGYFAAVPKSTQSVDVVALFAGVRAPFVLRPSDAYFKVIGPFFLHVVIDGEAFPENESDLEWITLC